MLSTLMRRTENCNACSRHRSTERVQFFFMTMPDGTTPTEQPTHQKWNELGYKVLPYLLYSPDLFPTDYYFFKHLSFMQGKHFYGKIMSLPFNRLSILVITFLPKSKHHLISWLQSPSAVILEPPKIKSVTVPIVSPSICHEVMGSDAMILVF